MNKITLFLISTSLVYGQGWFDNANTKLKTNTTPLVGGGTPNWTSGCPPNHWQPPGGGMPDYLFNDNCQYVIAASSGGAFDTKRNRLWIIGGGHAGYGGNEVYYYDFNVSPVVIKAATNPSIFDNVTCNEPNADGTPASVHTYGGLVYMPDVDKIFRAPGPTLCGVTHPLTFIFDPSNNTWTNANPTPTLASFGSPSSDGMRCFWNETRHRVDCEYGNNLMWLEYDPIGNTWTKLTNFSTYCTGIAACNSNQSISIAYDPIRKLALAVGGTSNTVGGGPGSLIMMATDFSTGTNYATQDWTSKVTGCSSLTTSLGQYPGLVYDPARGGFSIYPGGGNSVYYFNPSTRQCTAQTFTGGPTATAAQSVVGTFGRFGFLPMPIGKYFVATATDGDAFTFTLDKTPVAGLGSSTSTCKDRDGDGYGVGPGCLGIDADDLDNSVHSTTDVLAKWSTVDAFYNHLGYLITRKWFFSSAGNDSTCVVNDVTHPCLLYSHINALIRPGDAVIVRNGSNLFATPPRFVDGFPAVSGNPMFFLSYPGEQMVIDPGALASSKFQLTDCSFIVIDGFKTLNGAGISGGTTDGSATFADSVNLGGVVINSRFAHNIFKNWECVGNVGGLGCIAAFNGLLDITIEDSVLHDAGTGNQHNIYIGSRNLPSAMGSLRRLILYNGSYNNFHMNGRMFNFNVEQNKVYNAPIANLSLQNGISHSYVRNNEFFNYNGAALDMDTYPGSQIAGSCSPGQTGCNCGSDNLQICTCPGSSTHPGTHQASTVCPYDETDNLIENNVFNGTGTNPCANATCTSGSSALNQPVVVMFNSSFVPTINLGGNTYRNNIFQGYGNNDGGTPIKITDNNGTTCNASCLNWALTTNFINNIFWQSSSSPRGSSILRLGNTVYNCSTITPKVASSVGCLNVDPQFVHNLSTDWATPSLFNFRLTSTSPAIGTAIIGSTFDRDGNLYNKPSPSRGAFEVAGAVTPVCSFITSSIPSGMVGVPYSITLVTNGCTAPLVFSVSVGSLPGWATLNTSTGVISGTPNAAATTNFTIQLVDNTGQIITLPLSIIVTSIVSVPQFILNGTTTLKGTITIK